MCLQTMSIQTTEHLVGLLPAGAIPESIVISADNRHFACVAVEDGKMRAVYDGELGPLYEGIHHGTPILSPDGRHFAYAAQRGGAEFMVLDGVEGPAFKAIVEERLCFSPDSQRFAYVGYRDGKMVAIVDGDEIAVYDWIFRGPSFFSPDSRRVCLIGQHDEQVYIVLDGVEDEPVTAVQAGDPVFAPDSSRVAYIAQVGGTFVSAGSKVPQGLGRFQGGKSMVVCGGQRHQIYDQIPHPPVFSPDGSRIGYTGIRDNRAYINIDGVELGPYQSVAESMPIFSSHGRRVAYSVQSGGQEFVVVDEQQFGPYKGIGAGTPVFSPNEERIAYVVSRGLKSALVLDGQEQPAKYRYIQKYAFAFSPDSRRIAFAARPGLIGLKGCVEVDGVAGPVYLAVGLTPPVFSPDSRRVAYMASSGVTRSFAVVDGIEGQPCNKFADGTLRFSPDGSFTVYQAQVNGRAVIMVDGLPDQPGTPISAPDGTILRGSGIHFESDRKFTVLTLRANREIQTLEVTVAM